MVQLSSRLVRSHNYYHDGYYYSPWDSWVRWVVLVVVILLFLALFFIFSCISARRRRRAGRMPFYGTGWLPGRNPAAGGLHQQHPPHQTYAHYSAANSTPFYQPNQAQPAPPYTPAAPGSGYYGAQSQPGYFAGGQQQSGIELQQQQQHYPGQSPPLPQHPTGTYQPPRGDDAYMPPAGPPPGKA